jgi:hypothetical protein
MTGKVRRHSRLLLVLGLGLAGGVVITIVGFLVAGTRRPQWYHPAPLDRSRLHADKAALANLEEQISAALNAGQEARFQVDEDQLNRWLSAGAEIWPQLAVDLGPFQQPRVLLRDGRIQVAARSRIGGVQVVAVLDCAVEVTEDTLVLHWKPPRLGAIPAPRRWVSDMLTRHAIGTAVNTRVGTVTFDNDLVWPNGKRRFRLRELKIADGVATVVLEPLRTRPRPDWP